MENLHGYGRAAETIAKYRSPRYHALDQLERIVETKQYAGRPAYMDNECGKPLWERAPIITYGQTASVIEANGDLLFGDGRFPTLQFDESEDDPNPPELFRKLCKNSRLTSSIRDAFEQAQSCGTAVVICGIRAGRLFVDTTKAKWCEPTLNDDGEITKLEIKYAFLERFKDPIARRWSVRPRLYRRVIDDQHDTTFKPADAQPDGTEPNWAVSVKIAHGLGFCPVVWYAQMKGTATVDRIDGRAIHESLSGEIEALDQALSSRHRCALFLEPQICEFGVPPGYNPTETGRTPRIAAHAGSPMDISAATGAGIKLGSYDLPGEGTTTARKKGPGYTWQYPETARVEMLELSAGALTALSEHAADLRSKISERLAAVFLDPENVKFASTTSGKALEALKQRQLDRCNRYREDTEDHLLMPVFSMLLRIARDKIAAIRSKRFVKILGATMDLDIDDAELIWPDYFKADAAEETQASEQARGDLEAGLITTETAVRHIAKTYDIVNVEEYVVELEKRKAERMKEQQALMHAASGVMSDAEDSGTDRGGREEGSRRPGEAGSRGPGAPKVPPQHGSKSAA